MTLKDLAPFNGARPPASPRIRRTADWSLLSWNRREFLRTAGATAVAVGLASVGILPPARRALASHGGTNGYQIKPLPCPGYAGPHNCNPGCGDSEVDARSCVSSGHKKGWHRAGCNSAWGFKWKLRKDWCVSGTGWDGWLWSYDSTCGCCSSVTFRCHDGWRCNSNCASCVRTICRWKTACNELPGCT